MPLLLYCVTRASVYPKGSQTGVAGVPVERVEGPGLAAVLSRNVDSNVWLRAPVRTSALEFHRVIMELFESAAIIPFRFPTIFESDDELGAHLVERADEYESLLNQVADFVQTEGWLVRPGVCMAPTSGAGEMPYRS